MNASLWAFALFDCYPAEGLVGDAWAFPAVYVKLFAFALIVELEKCLKVVEHGFG